MAFSYQNPILPGFYPDPSCILVENTFYMINSSFQFFPGLPIHTSKDLIHWKLIGHAINRPAQLPLDLATTKVNNWERKEIFTAGLYAPTIRYHNGTFYIVCTNLTSKTADPQPDEDFAPQNFLITCTNLNDPSSFSDPVHFDFHGIDPSLFFDDDGKVYMQGSFIHGYRKNPATVIRQAEIDVSTAKLKGEAVDIWQGAVAKVPEGPHLYKKDGYYYLLTAEGGTHRGHRITIARSNSVWGPFKSYKKNPLICGKDGSDITCVGHGELFSDLNGNWWCCMLARRELGTNYPLGRETYLVPVGWPEGEWPTLDDVQLVQSIDEKHAEVVGQLRKTTQIETVRLSSPHTIYLRTPDLSKYTESPNGENSFVLEGSSVPLTAPTGSPTFIGQRQTSLNSEVSVTIDVSSISLGIRCGIALYKDTYRHVSIEFDGKRKTLSLIGVHHSQPQYKATTSVELNETRNVTLRIISSVDEYKFSAVQQGERGNTSHDLGKVSCADVSGDDFTGTIYGVYAVGVSGEKVELSNFQIASK